MNINNKYNIGDTVYFNERNAITSEGDNIIKDKIFAVGGTVWIDDETGESKQKICYWMDEFILSEVDERHVFETEVRAFNDMMTKSYNETHQYNVPMLEAYDEEVKNEDRT